MKKTILSYDDVKELYCNQGLSLKDVAKKLETSTMVVCRFVKANGLQRTTEEKVAATRRGCLAKYGVENPMQNKEILQKASETYFKKTGYRNPGQNPEAIQKANETKLERYGTANIMDCPEIVAKQKRTLLERYGVENPFDSPEIQERIRKERKERTGYENPMSNPEIREMQCRHNFEKYGVWISGRPTKSEIATKVVYNQDTFRSYIETLDKKTVAIIAEKLGCGESTVCRKLGEYGLWYLIENGASRYEDEIREFLASLGVNSERTRRVIPPKEIDIYCPECRVGIEFNGDYWHSENKVERSYHYQKSKLAAEHNVFLYHIFEYEWKNPEKRQRIKNQLKNILHRNSKTIYARKCELRDVSNTEKDEFLSINHVQGKDTSSIRYGLYFENELVSLMTFCKPRFSKKYDWELSRFCSKADCNVVGGASKLFKHFVANHSGVIVSYSDIAKTRGGLYEKLGFEFLHVSAPNYVWIDRRGGIFTRYQCQMKNETEIMTERGYVRVYDCGNKVWVYDPQKIKP